MELASRILSVLLGAAVMVFVLWLGFGEVWWVSRQAQAPVETNAAIAPPSAPAPVESTEPPTASSEPVPSEPQTVAPAKQLPEAQQTAAVSPQAVAPKATKLYRRVTVRDAGTLKAGGVVIRLAGIVTREVDATCKDVRGKTWRCGAAAKAALAKLIRARTVSCALPKGGEHNIIIARCSVGGTDLSTWLLRQGWAEPQDINEALLVEAAQAARKERLGFWRGAN